jgi:hypothetical protein
METGSIKINLEENKAPSVEAQLVNNNLWLTKNEIARLLNCFVQKIDAELRNIFKNNLLWEDDCTYCNRYIDKGIDFISYRVNSFEAKVLRQFINSSLRENLLKDKEPKAKFFWTYLPMQNNYWLN